MDHKTANYKVIHHILGNRYQFFCDLSGAYVCTSKMIHMKSKKAELEYAWAHDCKNNFNQCRKCGKWVIDAMYNAEVLECVQCAPYEEEPILLYEDAKFTDLESYGFGPNIMKKTRICSKCGRAINTSENICPVCGNQLNVFTLYDWYKKMHASCI